MHEWVSVGEASRRLNVSPSTIRRMIEAGALVAERELIGGSKDRYLVRLDAPETHQAASYDASGPQTASESGDAPVTPQTLPTTPHDAPPFNESALNILDMLLQTSLDNEREQAERIAALMRQLGAAEAERDILRAAHADCSNLSHAEASRIVQEATEQRFRAEQAERERDAARAEAERLKGRSLWDRLRNR